MHGTKLHGGQPPSKVLHFSDLSRLRIFLKLRLYRHETPPWHWCRTGGANVRGRKEVPNTSGHAYPPRRLNTDSPRTTNTNTSGLKVPDGEITPSGTPPLRKARKRYLELVVSLPQHSGCSGNAERSQPPPRAWTRVTASTMRRPRIFTAVSSSERAAL